MMRLCRHNAPGGSMESPPIIYTCIWDSPARHKQNSKLLHDEDEDGMISQDLKVRPED
jgi:hypothetical protein